jgi:hypothetical protein
MQAGLGATAIDRHDARRQADCCDGVEPPWPSLSLQLSTAERIDGITLVLARVCAAPELI